MPATDIFFIPNLLSLLRILLAPLAYLSLTEPQLNILPVLILTAVIIVSDFLDGALARRLNQSTRLGLILDPLGDKVCLFAVVLGLLVSERVSPLFFAVIMAKDVLILLGGVFLMGKTKEIIPSNRMGKWATAFLACGAALVSLSEGLAQTCLDGAPEDTLAAEYVYAQYYTEGAAGEGFLNIALLVILPWIARLGMLAGVFAAVFSLAGYAAELARRVHFPLRGAYLTWLCAVLAALVCVLLIASLPSLHFAHASPWRWI
jgi:cardiolipin synthase